MKNKLLSLGILGFGLLLSSLIATNGASAQTAPASVQFPIAELGNCKDKNACKTYCDDASHTAACLAFAQKNNLMSQDEITAAKKFTDAGSRGPGGCTGKEACQAYCDNISHIDECVTFAEKTGMLPPSQLVEAKQVQAAIAKGIKPPACNGKKECDAYCEDPSHMKECVAFGEASGFLTGKQLGDAKKMITAIDNGAVPPACKGKEACDAYCSSPDHIEACMTFARAAGLMTPEEAQNSQKMIDAVKKGFKPPNCNGKEACDAYCAEPAHADECIQFSVAAGFMTQQQAEIAKKTGGKGPGGCVGKDACDAFCNNPDNQQTCVNFAKDNGMISEQDAQRMQEGQQKFKESMQNISTEVADCMKAALGSDTFEKIKSGQAMPPKDMPDKISSCFAKAQPVQGPAGSDQAMPPVSAVSSMPQGAQDCVKAAIGADAFAKFQAGTLSREEQQGLFEKAKSCLGRTPGQESMQKQGPPAMRAQQVPGTQFMPRVEPGQTSPQEQPSQGEQFAPGSYPNSMPPEGQRPPNVQFAPGTQPMMPPTSGGAAPAPLPPTSSTAPGAGGTIAPGMPVPQAQPIAPTAPQSSNFGLDSSLASVINALGKFSF